MIQSCYCRYMLSLLLYLCCSTWSTSVFLDGIGGISLEYLNLAESGVVCRAVVELNSHLYSLANYIYRPCVCLWTYDLKTRARLSYTHWMLNTQLLKELHVLGYYSYMKEHIVKWSTKHQLLSEGPWHTSSSVYFWGEQRIAHLCWI